MLLAPGPAKGPGHGSASSVGGASVVAPGDRKSIAVVLVGMSGAGKSTLGAAVADMLCADFLDLDEVVAGMPAAAGRRPAQLVSELGWEAFRALELEAVTSIIGDADAVGLRILACGGGTLETPGAEELLVAHWPVVFVDRHIDDIVEGLERAAALGDRCAAGSTQAREDYERRLPVYLRCSNFIFPVARGDFDTDVLGLSLARVVRHILGWSKVHLGPDTFVLQLALPSLLQVPAQTWRAALGNVDIVELHVDRLAAAHDERRLAQEVAQLRRYLFGIPLLFTVRSADAGGYFAGSEAQYLALLQLGLRLAVDFLDVECLRQAAVDEVLRCRGTTKLVGTFHELREPLPPDSEQIAKVLRRCELGGFASVVRLDVRGKSRQSAWLIQEIAEATVKRPFVAMCLEGAAVRLSQILNRCFCPVAPPLGTLTCYAGPEALHDEPCQLLPLQELLDTRRLLSLCTPAARQFPIFGPWRSELPRMLAAVCDGVCKELGLPTRCLPEPASTDEEVRRFLQLTSVGGALLLGPLKQDAMSLVHRFSTPVAEAAQAVDCLQREEDGTFTGISTEHQALAARIRALGLCSGPAGASERIGLVLGSGPSGRSAAAALLELGFSRVLHAAGNEEQFFTYTVHVDTTGGEALGFDVSHDGGISLRVESITSGLVDAWNQAQTSPVDALHVRPGDLLVDINGTRGSVRSLIGQLSTRQPLKMRFRRHIAASPLGVEAVQDLTSLAALVALDVLVLAEPPAEGYYGFAGSQWLQPTISRFRPVVIETTWPPPLEAVEEDGPKRPGLAGIARELECPMVEAMDLFFERLCNVLQLWTGMKDATVLERVRTGVSHGLARQLTLRGHVVPPSLTDYGQCRPP